MVLAQRTVAAYRPMAIDAGEEKGMRHRRGWATALVIAATLGLVAAACGGDNKGSSSATTTGGGGCKAGTATVPGLPDETADGKGKTIGLLFDVTGRGDKSFNDAAALAVDTAKKNFGVTGEESTPTAVDGSDRPARLKAFIGDELIVANGFLWLESVTKSATANPNQKYALIDDKAVDKAGKPLPNVRSMVFATNENSFLVGAAAACASKAGKIGFIGGVQNDLIKGFEVGFTAGVKQINPKATVEIKYITVPPDFSGFNDPAKGKAITAAMLSKGIDVVYAAAGGSGKGMFAAATASGKKPGDIWTIGVDSDQYQSASAAEKPYILTSALKRVDVAVYEAIADQLNGKLTGELKTYDLKNKGVGYSVSNTAVNQYVGTLEDLKQQIIDGKITVPTK
jgi:basic membrane protein A